MRYLLIYLVLWGLWGCNSNEGNKVSQVINVQNFSGVHQVTYAFSDLNQLDTFSLELLGKSSKDMSLRFKIVNFKGQEIYNTQLKATDLVESTDPNINLNKEKDRLALIKTIAANFFDEENFLEPAVMEDQVADKNMPDPRFFEELKNNQLNGFIYRLAKDKNLYIAWSPEAQKVKVYYSCC